MARRKLNQKDVVWCESDNHYATRNVYHGYYSTERLTELGKWTGEKKMGNSALCNKHFGQANENGEFIPIEEVENSGLDRDKVCKRCLIIYDKLPK